MKIIVELVNPPIPDRRFDWCAYYEGHDQDDPVGWGATAFEAECDLAGTTADAEDYRRESAMDR